MLLNGEWFFIRWKDVQRDISLTPYKARSCKELLERDGLIETKMMTHPQKQYYRINGEPSLNHQSLNYLTINRQITKRYNNTIENSINIYSLGNIGFPKEWQEDLTLKSTIEKWIKWREQKGFPNDLPLIRKLCEILTGLGSIEDATKSIKRSIKNNWRSIQPLPAKRIPVCPFNFTFGADFSTKAVCNNECAGDHEKTWSKCQSAWQTIKSKNPPCPLGFTFGRDFNRYKKCNICGEFDPKTWVKCESEFQNFKRRVENDQSRINTKL